MRRLCFIPARMGSSRFPGKPLFEINGKPLIQWVYEAAHKANIDKLYITTPDNEIIQFCKENNYPFLKTSNNHERCLDRIYESYQYLDQKKSDDLIICMQGDEPLVNYKMINCIIKFHENKKCDFTVAGLPITESQFKDQNIVKIAYDDNFKTIYTSRSPIPHSKNGFKEAIRIFGLFTLSPNGIKMFHQLPPSRLEIIESCDTNRILGTNLKQYVCILDNVPTQQSVDVLEDAEIASNLLKIKDR
tara:strand:+ start:396 stop:1133 length:738 start_codon:yes stop_codon:yes gene_type:complete